MNPADMLMMCRPSGPIPLDYTTFTEVDPANDFTVSKNKVVVDTLLRSEDAWIYKDFSAGYFAGNFTHQVDFKYNSSVSFGSACFWSLTNVINGWFPIQSSGDMLNTRVTDVSGDIQIKVESTVGGVRVGSGVISLTPGVQYYCEVERDESVGTYGTIYLRVYTDVARTVLHGNVSLLIGVAKTDFRYLYAAQGYGSGTLQSITFDVENLTIISNG